MNRSVIPSTSPKRNLTRKNFLDLAWKGVLALSGALGLGSICHFLSYQPKSNPATLFDLGNAEDLPKEVLLSVSEAQAVVLSTDQGFKAVSMICPHLGCLVEPRQEHFQCPCHGSQFTFNGDLKKGPANSPLSLLRVEISDEGHLILDTSES